MPAAATAGIVSHRAYFIYGEHHANGPMLLRFYITLVVVLFASQIIIGGRSTTAASKETTMLVTVYAISIFASIGRTSLPVPSDEKLPRPIWSPR